MKRPQTPNRLTYINLIQQELQCDLGVAGDITTDAIVAADHSATGVLVARKAGRVCGLDVALSTFQCVDAQVIVEPHCDDGDDVSAQQILAQLTGSARALLAAERTALNLLMRLSGIATATQQFVQCIADYPVRLACTRKTTPGLRGLEKYAVRVGGGINHRFGLYDAVLIKDNHRSLAGGVTAAVECVRQQIGHVTKIEVEVDTLDQLREALQLGVELVLLDNMTLAELCEAVVINQGAALLEASGGITRDRIQAVAATGVDIISLGYVTHSAPSLDISFDLM